MIDRELAAFLEEGAGHSHRHAQRALEPNGARAIAVVVDADGAHVDRVRAEGGGGARAARSRERTARRR